MREHLRPALVILLLMTLITGVGYPLVVTGIAQALFPAQANGSLIVKDGKPVGSTLIGQPFDDPKYFWSRPSATSPFADNAGSSSGSNLSPTNADLVTTLHGRVHRLRAADAGPALAQRSLADLLGREATPQGQPKSLLEEMFLYGYLENSYVVNLGQASRGNTNDIRFYDHDVGYTWNALELSFKKDPSERYTWGFGVVVTAGMDSQEHHSIGIFRDLSDSLPNLR